MTCGSLTNCTQIPHWPLTLTGVNSQDNRIVVPRSPRESNMASPSRFIRQAAAIAVKDSQVCLITSRSGRRWIIPKGMMEVGKTAAEIALQEAWEEAGLVGVLGSPVGTYEYEKYGGTCLVTVYLMQVHAAREHWPECGERRR